MFCTMWIQVQVPYVPAYIRGKRLFSKCMKPHRVITQRDNIPSVLFSGYGPKWINKQINMADQIPNLIRKVG